MQIVDALKIKNEEGGIKQGEQNKLCSTHNLIPPQGDITLQTVIDGAKKLLPIDPIEVVEILPKDYFKPTKENKKIKDDFDEGK